jgi:hypothetical protein
MLEDSVNPSISKNELKTTSIFQIQTKLNIYKGNIKMPSTVNCTRVGQHITRMKGAFDDSAISLLNTHKNLTNEVWLKLQVFWLKKDAEQFCERWGFSKGLITRVESRWQRGFAIGLGRNDFAPVCAESRLVAHAMGCVVNNVEVSK